MQANTTPHHSNAKGKDMLSELEQRKANCVSRLLEYERFNMPIRATYEKGRIAAFTTAIDIIKCYSTE